MNCFCGMVDRLKVFSLISSQDHCQRSSPSRICNTLRAGCMFFKQVTHFIHILRPRRGSIFCIRSPETKRAMFISTIFLSLLSLSLPCTNLSILRDARQQVEVLLLFLLFEPCIFDESLHYATHYSHRHQHNSIHDNAMYLFVDPRE